VARELAGGLGLRVEEEKVVGAGAISVDALIQAPEGSGLAPVAVEADGPHHFFSNDKQVPTGTTALKRRLLDLAVQRGELSGWVSVPYWAWHARRTEPLQKQLLLRELLQGKGVDVEMYSKATQ
jgi:hypothetical protein